LYGTIRNSRRAIRLGSHISAKMATAGNRMNEY
jgi:hypothetical protein